MVIIQPAEVFGRSCRIIKLGIGSPRMTQTCIQVAQNVELRCRLLMVLQLLAMKHPLQQIALLRLLFLCMPATRGQSGCCIVAAL